MNLVVRCCVCGNTYNGRLVKCSHCGRYVCKEGCSTKGNKNDKDGRLCLTCDPPDIRQALELMRSVGISPKYDNEEP